MRINGKFCSNFKGIGVSTVMDKKGNDTDSKELDVSLEKSTLDLKAIRESMGLTLRSISSSTRISPANLKAVENQKFGLLPEPIYTRAFIGAYARALDIDAEKILSLYDKYLEGLEPVENRNELLKKLAGKRHHTKFWIWLAIASCVVVLTGFFYLYQWSKDDRREMTELAPVEKIENSGEAQDFSVGVPAPEKNGITAEGDDKTPEAESPDLSGSTGIPDVNDIKETGRVIEGDRQAEVEGEQPKEEAAPGKAVTGIERPYTLVIKASELTWIQINRDEEPPFEVMLRPGERITERASERFDLIVGNAAGVDISFQGKPLGLLGEHGEVVHLTLPADM